MSLKKTRCLTALALLVAAGLAVGAHITDKLVVGLYEEPGSGGTPLQLLSSGTPVEVLQKKDGYSEVRLSDDTRGWVASTYVTDEKPAKAMLLEAQARLRQMGIELAALREEAAGQDAVNQPPPADPPSAREAELRRSLDQAETRIAELERQVAAQPAEEGAAQQLELLRDRVRQAAEILTDGQRMGPEAPADSANPGIIGRYQSWIVGAIMLLVGFGGGVAFIDYRIRRRYGGFRI